MSNSLDPDQARRIVGPDLGPNSLPRLSADDTGRQRVKTKSIYMVLIPNELRHKKTCLQGFSTRSHTKWAIHPQKMVRGLKFGI